MDESSSSLLDKVLQNKESLTPFHHANADQDTIYYTQDGTPIYQSTIDAVNRILTHPDNRDLYSTPPPDPQIYSVHDRSHPLDFSSRTVFLSRLHGDWTPPTPYQAVLAIDLLHQYLPCLSRDYYQVLPGPNPLYWDIRNQRLVRFPGPE